MKQLLRLVIFLFCAVHLTGCDSLEYRGSAQFVLYIEDSPADYKSLKVSISSVELFDGSQWGVVESLKQPFNLLALTGGNMLKIAQGNIPNGHYTKLRVTFNTNDIVLGNQKETFQVSLPEQYATLEFDTDLEFTTNTQAVAILDVQVAESLTETPVGFIFKPVGSLFNPQTMGVLQTMILDAQGQPIPESMLVQAVSTANNSVVSTYSNISTGKIVMRLNADTYNILLTPDSTSTYLPTTANDIKITAGQPTVVMGIKVESTLLPEPQ